MAWLAPLPGRLLERAGNSTPRGMVVHDRTRLNDRLPTSFDPYEPPALQASASLIMPIASPADPNALALMERGHFNGINQSTSHLLNNRFARIVG